MLRIKRFFAFVVDFILFVSVFTALQTLFNLVYPGNYIPPKAMQLFTSRQLEIFFITLGAALVMLYFYLKVSYSTISGQTVGHKLFGIQIVDLEGNKLSSGAQNFILLLAAIRFVIFFLPGPIVALRGGGLALSVFVLLWGTLLILPISYKRREERVTLWQHLGKYRFQSTKF